MMRGFWLLVCALCIASPVSAQQGLGDPLGLASSGVLMPFIGHGSISVLEVASPRGANPNLHMLFFEETCARVGISAGLQEGNNSVAFLTANRVLPGSGLAAVAGVDSVGFDLIPLTSPVHARTYLFEPDTGRSSILDPVILDAAENPGGTSVWSALRPAVTFFAPPQTAVVHTRIILVCPTNTIQGGTGAAFPTGRGFPAITPGFPATDRVLNVRIYLPDGEFVRDTHVRCQCLSDMSVTDISNVYASLDAPNGTWTEIEVPEGTAGFTGYRGVFTVGAGLNNFFGRLSNAGVLISR